MKLRMSREVDGAEDGIHVVTYKAGEVYAFPAGSVLSRIFLEEGWAQEVKSPPSEAPTIAPSETKLRRRTR